MAKTNIRGTQIVDASVDLTVDVTGTLPVGNGGTGNATNTLNSLLVGNGTGALTALAPGAAGNLLQSNGTTWSGTAAIKDTNGNSILDFSPTGAAVNYLAVGNNATGNSPYISCVGGDSNISMGFVPKGSASGITFWDNNFRIVLATNPGVASAVNYVFAQNAATGNDPSIGSWGSDTDVGFNLTTRGAGAVKANGVAVTTIAGNPNVCTANLTIPAAYSCIRTDYIEIASGVTLEVGAGAYLDIT